jgi:isopenicillin-N epimerase
MASTFAGHWNLDPGRTFLNHGSFGATPRSVLAAQERWRVRMEAEPVEFFAHDVEPALDAARVALAAFVGSDADDVAFVPNATTGFNAVLRSLPLDPGDELLTTDHAYNAARNALEFVAGLAHARVVVAPIPLPVEDPRSIQDAILRAVTPRTRLALVDHVTSATALVLPIGTIVAALAERGVDTLVDGAHAPGMLPLDVAAIGAAYYTGNLHKWVCAPKGAAFLWVRRDRQAGIRPLAISHGANDPRADRSRFRLEFDWTGTADPSAYLAVPDAIAFGASLVPGGWPELRERNRSLAIEGRRVLEGALGVESLAPETMVGSMASIALPGLVPGGRVQGISLYGDPVHDALLARHAIQVMTTPWPQRPNGGPWRRLLRISAAPYNDIGDYRRLAAVIPGVAREATEGSAVSGAGHAS